MARAPLRWRRAAARCCVDCSPSRRAHDALRYFRPKESRVRNSSPERLPRTTRRGAHGRTRHGERPTQDRNCRATAPANHRRQARSTDAEASRYADGTSTCSQIGFQRRPRNNLFTGRCYSGCRPRELLVAGRQSLSHRLRGAIHPSLPAVRSKS